MRVRPFLIAVTSLAAVVAGLTCAPSASADQIWHQSVGTSTPKTQCQTSNSTDLTAGRTRNRSIVWEKDTPPLGCVQTTRNLPGTLLRRK
jgi:hypothetical protein